MPLYCFEVDIPFQRFSGNKNVYYFFIHYFVHYFHKVYFNNYREAVVQGRLLSLIVFFETSNRFIFYHNKNIFSLNFRFKDYK